MKSEHPTSTNDEHVFKDGEVMPMHEFVDRFKAAVCEGVETSFWQWPVRVVWKPDGELLIALGTSHVGKVKGEG